MPSPTVTIGVTTGHQAISESLGEKENAQRSLASVDMTLLKSDIQTLLEEKASLQSEIAMLRMERDGLSMEVTNLQETKQNLSKEVTSLKVCNKEAPEDLDASEKRPPQHFICPLTLEVMSMPMEHKVTKHNFERKAIFEWIYFGKATCPLTRKKLHPEDFVENVTLREEIDSWKTKHGLDEDDSDDSDSDSEGGMDDSNLIKDLSPEEEKEQQARLMETQIKRNGSHNQLMGIRSRVLQQRNARVRRRLSGGGLF